VSILSIKHFSLKGAELPIRYCARKCSLKKISSSFFLILLIFFSVSCQNLERSGLAPGNNAPDFTLPDLSGERVSLSDFRGKVVLLNFWASWCAPCVVEMPALERAYNQLKDRGFVVLAVAIDDDLNAIKEFQKDLGLTFPILLDNTSRTKNRYKISGYPETYIIDAEGKMVLFSDPEGNMPVVKILGPREWDSPNAIQRISQLLPE